MIVTVHPSVSHLRRAARRSGQVARCRQGVFDVYPKPETRNPDTPDQKAARAAWSKGSGGWGRLSTDRKTAWSAYAEKNARYFSRRTAEPLTGYRVFQAAAGYRQILGMALPDEAPVLPPPPALRRIELLASPDSRTFRFRLEHDLQAESGCHVVVSVTPATLRPSRKPERRNGRHLRGWGAASTAPLPMSGGTVEFADCRFAVKPGERFGVWIRVVREVDGLGGEELFADLIRPETEPEAEPVPTVEPESEPGSGAAVAVRGWPPEGDPSAASHRAIDPSDPRDGGRRPIGRPCRKLRESPSVTPRTLCGADLQVRSS